MYYRFFQIWTKKNKTVWSVPSRAECFVSLASSLHLPHQVDSSRFHASGWICWICETDVYNLRHIDRFTTARISESAGLTLEQMIMVRTGIWGRFRFVMWHKTPVLPKKKVRSCACMCNFLWSELKTREPGKRTDIYTVGKNNKKEAMRETECGSPFPTELSGPAWPTAVLTCSTDPGC